MVDYATFLNRLYMLCLNRLYNLNLYHFFWVDARCLYVYLRNACYLWIIKNVPH